MAYGWPTDGKAEPRMNRFGASGFEMITVKIGSRPLDKEGSAEKQTSFHASHGFAILRNRHPQESLSAEIAILRHFVAEWLRP